MVFNSRDRYGDCLRLLRYGAASFQSVPVLPKAAPAAYVPVRQGQEAGVLLLAGDEVWCCYTQEEKAGLRLRWNLPAELIAPVEEGRQVGSLIVVNQAGQELAQVPRTAARAVAAIPLTWWQKLLRKAPKEEFAP